jgi:hypothetical protein
LGIDPGAIQIPDRDSLMTTLAKKFPRVEEPPARASSPEGNKCLESFNSSTVGQVARFSSAVNFFTDIKNTWAEWLLFPPAKFGAIAAVKKLSNFIGSTEFLPVPTAGEGLPSWVVPQQRSKV